MTDKQKAIFDKIGGLIDRLEDYRCEMTLLQDACKKLSQEKDAAIQRAEKAETQSTKFRNILKLYGNPDNWRFTHDKETNPLWVTSLGPDYAMEILNEFKRQSSKEKEEGGQP